MRCGLIVGSMQEAEGVVMSIPMPGHPVTSQEEDGVVNDCRHLHELINSHDVVFLLTDTRESRWLPTLICAALNKVMVERLSFFFSRHIVPVVESSFVTLLV